MSEHDLESVRAGGGPIGPGAQAAADGLSSQEHRPSSPLRAVHRQLRGRYGWALLLAAAGAAGGAFAGFRMQAPQYRADGLIRIAASMPSARDPRGLNIPPMFRAFVDEQVTMLKSYRLADIAVKSEPWRAAGQGTSADAIPQFMARSSANLSGDSLIAIQFVDESPDVALAGVRALLAAYDEFLVDENRKSDKMGQAATQAAELELSLKEIDGRILKVPSEYGGEEALEIRHSTTMNQVLADEDLLRRVQGRIRRLESASPAPEVPRAAPAPFVPKSASELALENPQLQTWMLDVELLTGKIELRAEKFGEQDDQLVALRRELEVRKRLIASFVENANNRRKLDHDLRPDAPTTGGETLADLKAQESVIEEHLAAMRKESQAYGAARVELRRLRAERDEVARKLDDTKQWKDELAGQLAGSGRIAVLYRGDRPVSPFKDRRSVAAVAGGLFGAGLGVLIVFLIGLRDRRLRTSEDIATSLSRLRLLGLMPELPSDLGDAQGAEIAAHCVHQIRTLLQIGHSRDHGGAYCITGPGVGSGKTTLAFALGLSFGRSGTRTLLVDADLSGRGLTWRVGQMLLSNARRIAGESGDGDSPISPVVRDPSTDSAFLESLAVKAGDSERPGSADLANLLSRAFLKHGPEVIRASGLLSQLVALADLRFPGKGRFELQARLETLLMSGASRQAGSAADWIDPPYLELRADHPEFNGTPLDRYLFPTATKSLRFLPLRNLGGAGGVSMATLSKIIARVRDEFDIVLVDTGPVLGAVETSIVAVQSDAVVFVVSPADHRPDAELAVAQLEAVGARIAGVVFNRAAAADVLRSSRSHSVLRDQGDPT
jgi:Mrp family chromosome partitioning ATPase